MKPLTLSKEVYGTEEYVEKFLPTGQTVSELLEEIYEAPERNEVVVALRPYRKREDNSFGLTWGTYDEMQRLLRHAPHMHFDVYVKLSPSGNADEAFLRDGEQIDIEHYVDPENIGSGIQFYVKLIKGTHKVLVKVAAPSLDQLLNTEDRIEDKLMSTYIKTIEAKTIKSIPK